MSHIRSRNSDFAALIAVPCRDTMSPPQLTRDAPVTNVMHPREIIVRELRRNKFGSSLLHRRNGGFGQRLDSDEPLRRQQRFDHSVATLAVSDVMCKRLGPGKQALRLQIDKYAFASFHSIQTAVR